MNIRRNKKLLYAVALGLMTGVAIADDDNMRGPKWQLAIDDLQAQIDNIELTPGPKGDPGPQGPAGFSNVYREVESLSVDTGVSGRIHHTAYCAVGDVVLGGGFSFEPTFTPAELPYNLVRSAPGPSIAPSDQFWNVELTLGAPLPQDATLFVYAVCADISE